MVKIASSCLILLAFGCAAEPTLETAEQGLFFDNPPPGDDCESWVCGGNSPVMKVYRFWDLPEPQAGSTVTNLQGFRITGFHKGLENYDLDVVEDEIIGRDTTWPYQDIRGTSVVGAWMSIHNDETNEDFQMKIAEVGRVVMSVHPSGRSIITRTYRFQWIEVGGYATWFQDLCGASTEPDGITPFHAVVFDDDRIDAAAIKVLGARRNWFNIGCKGHALSKQHLLGHTNAAGTLITAALPPGSTPWHTTYAARTAHLKMLAADYCGTGNPFTIAGEALQWRDVNNGYNTITGGAQIEARWGEDGAFCLNTPRVDYNHSTPTQEFPTGVESRITMPWCASRPPPCTGWMADINNMSNTAIISAEN